jgi:hypothetical protein
MNEHWFLGANDNDWLGWGITVAYLVAAALCLRCGRGIRTVSHDPGDRECWLWWYVGTAVLLFGVNKQLDLQTPLFDFGRTLAKTEGWYRYRRTVQVWFVVATAAIAFVALIAAGAEMRRTWRQHALLYAGVVILVGFVVLRAATFNHVREAVKWSPPIHGARSIMEVAGIACIGLSAVRRLGRSG